MVSERRSLHRNGRGRPVLILVLVEDGLGVKGASFNTVPIGVLILVLVEDGLGEFKELHKDSKLDVS